MTILYILAQVFAVLGIVFALISAIMKTKRWMLTFMLCGSLCNITSYALIMSLISVVVCVFALTRTIWYYILTHKEKATKNFLLPMCLVLIGFSICFPFLYKEPIDCILIISTYTTTIILAFRNMLAIRLGLIVSCVVWFVYDWYLASYVMVLSDVGHVVMYIIAIIIYNIIPYCRTKKQQDMQTLTPTLEIIQENKTKHKISHK